MLNWGIIGSGFISHAMLGAIANSDRSRAVAISGRSEAAREKMRAQYGIDRGYADYAALLADDGVDAVYIGLPNQLHHAAAIAALRAGKAVLSEKSLTLTMVQAEELAAAAQETGRFFAEGLMYRNHPMIADLVATIKDPNIGELRAITGHYAASIADVVNAEGGGTIYNLGCYPVSLTHLVVQTMCGLDAFSDHELGGFGNLNQEGNIADAALTMRFGNGVLASLQSTDSYGMAHGFKVLTTAGVLECVSNPWLPKSGASRMIFTPYGGPSRDIVTTADGDAFDYQLRMVEGA